MIRGVERGHPYAVGSLDLFYIPLRVKPRLEGKQFLEAIDVVVGETPMGSLQSWLSPRVSVSSRFGGSRLKYYRYHSS